MPASCFGKLPIFADFIRHNANGAEVAQLDQWYQEGIYLARQVLGSRWDVGYDKTPPSRFVFRPAGGSRFLIGVSVAGTDKAGRKYPFAIFHTVDAGPYEKDPSVLPAVFDDFLDAAQDLATKGWVGGDMKALLAKVEALAPAAATDASKNGYGAFLKQKAAPFWTELFGSADHASRYVVLHNLRELLNGLRNVPLGKLAYGLKFPLPASLDSQDTEYGISFWMELAFRLLGQVAFPPLVVWNQRGTSADPSLFVFFNNPSARYFIPLFRRDFDSDHVVDLARPTDPGGVEKFKSSMKSVLDDPALTLGDLVSKLSGQ